MKRIIAERQALDRHRSSTINTQTETSPIAEHWRRHLVNRLALGESLAQIDRDLRLVPGLTDEQRAALWLLAWGESQRHPPTTKTATSAGEPHEHDRPRRRAWQTANGDRRDNVIASTLELARAETSMDVAVLGEIRGGREVVRHLAGDAESFGLTLGTSMPIEETYCQRLLEGHLANVVTDAGADKLVRDLEITRAAQIGAYIGVPLTTLNARLYVLCCLAHERQPTLSERDVVFLHGLGATITVELDTAALA